MDDSSFYDTVCPSCYESTHTKQGCCTRCEMSTTTHPRIVLQGSVEESSSSSRRCPAVARDTTKRVSAATTPSPRRSPQSSSPGRMRSTAVARNISRVIHQNHHHHHHHRDEHERTTTTTGLLDSGDNTHCNGSSSSSSSSNSSAETEEEGNEDDNDKSDDARVEVVGVSSLETVLEQRRKAAEAKGEVVDLSSDSEDTTNNKNNNNSKPQKITVDDEGHEILWIDDDDENQDDSSTVEILEPLACSECKKPVAKENNSLCEPCVKAFSEASKAMDELEQSTSSSIQKDDNSYPDPLTNETPDPTRPDADTSVSQQQPIKCDQKRLSDKGVYDADTEKSDEEDDELTSTTSASTGMTPSDDGQSSDPLGSSTCPTTHDAPIKSATATNERQLLEQTATAAKTCIECQCNFAGQGRRRDLCTQCAGNGDSDSIGAVQDCDWPGDIDGRWFDDDGDAPTSGNTGSAPEDLPSLASNQKTIAVSAPSDTKSPITNPFKRRRTQT
eukprot:scaffold3608_cov183-Amphora_coffeaeformis.AAC.7